MGSATKPKKPQDENTALPRDDAQFHRLDAAESGPERHTLHRSVQIAFAGHNRAQDLGPRGRISRQLDQALELLRAAGVRSARLLTGLASGADILAAASWREAGLGPVHAVLPYLDFRLQGQVGPGGVADSATWLDGAAAEAEGRNAHLKQTRMIVEAADLVVVVWTGEPARGAGGTADAVLCALQVGLPVLWLKPGDPGLPRLIRPENLPKDFHFPEFQEALHHGRLHHVQEASADAIAQLLALDKLTPAAAMPEFAGRIRRAVSDLMHSSLWKAYPWFRNLLGGRLKPAPPAPPAPPASLAAQPGFQLLTRAYSSADRIANRLSTVHRSEQVLLILGMVMAAFIGSAWAIWPEFKLWAVWLELVLSVAALFVWAVASDARQHERWSEHRFLAERLRLERACWALGIGLGRGTGQQHGGDAGAWRQVRRDAGLPHGRYDADRARTWSAWALSELVQGQAAYHRAVSTRDVRIAHRIHRFESASFLWFFAIFTFYLASHMGGLGALLPKWFSGVITMTGAVVPALAAAAMALESKLEFQEQGERSGRIASVLDRFAAQLKDGASFEESQGVAREAVRLHLAESGHWQEGVSRRRLFRG